MTHAIRETEGHADRAGLVVRDLRTAIENATKNGWDTADLEAQLKEATRSTAVAIRNNDVARFKALGAQGGEQARNKHAVDMQAFAKARDMAVIHVRELRNAIRMAAQRGEDTKVMTAELLDATSTARRNTRVHAVAQEQLDNGTFSGAVDAPALIKHRGETVTVHAGGIAKEKTITTEAAGNLGVTASPQDTPDTAAPANDA